MELPGLLVLLLCLGGGVRDLGLLGLRLLKGLGFRILEAFKG